MNAIKRWGAIALALIFAVILANFMTPRERMAERLGEINLESAIPKRFGEWEMDERSMQVVVNPQQQEVLSRIYSQTLSRTYINKRTGATIMLAIAYGEDQRDSMQLHYPEACYPAQGFQLGSESYERLMFADRVLPIKHLVASMGATRVEPITYWVMIGEQPTQAGWRKKVTEMGYGFRGLIPDGMLFRVSSIGVDATAQYQVHDRFVSDLFNELPATTRGRLFGTSVVPHNTAI